MIVMHEFGRHLVVEPFVETVVLAGGLIEHAARRSSSRASSLKSSTAQKIWTLAWTEKASRFDFATCRDKGAARGSDYMLTGAKAMVIAAPWADYLIVSARTSGDDRDRGGVSLFVVDRRADRRRSPELQDHRRPPGCRARPARRSRGQLLGAEGEGVAALEACRDRAIGALCAEAVGAIGELNSATLEYSEDAQAVRRHHRFLPGAAALEWSTCSSHIRRRFR